MRDLDNRRMREQKKRRRREGDKRRVREPSKEDRDGVDIFVFTSHMLTNIISCSSLSRCMTETLLLCMRFTAG